MSCIICGLSDSDRYEKYKKYIRKFKEIFSYVELHQEDITIISLPEIPGDLILKHSNK